MKLSKRTWHYKLYRYLRNFFEDGPIVPFRKAYLRTDYKPKSICSYFWATVLMSMFLPVVTGLLVICATVLLGTSPLWILPWRRYKRIDQQWTEYKKNGGPKPARNFIGYKTTRAEKGESIIVAWFKSFKNEHCALITLTD